MKLRTIAAAAVAAGVLTLGGASVALADNAPTRAPAAKCVKAPAALSHLQDRLSKMSQRVAALQKRDAAAKANHKDDRAKTIETRIDKVQAVHQRIADRMTAIENRCNLPAPPAAPGS